MAIDSYRLEKLCSQISGELIDYYGYDPVEPYQKNPEEPDFDIEKLRQIKERQVIVSTVRDLFYVQRYSSKAIAKELKQPLKRIRGIIAILEASEGDAIRKKQVETMFLNNHQSEDIAEVLKLPILKVNLWLVEMGYLPTTEQFKHQRSTPKSVIKQYHSKDIKQQVLKLCRETDLKYSVIAKLIGIPRTTVNRWCKKSTKKSRIYRPTLEQKTRAIDLCRNTKYSYPIIAKMIKTSANTVRRWCQGIPRPQ